LKHQIPQIATNIKYKQDPLIKCCWSLKGFWNSHSNKP